jgi:hypothetical protein
MQPIDFTFVVLPLGAIVVFLVVTILLMETRKEVFQDKKITRAVEKLGKEKTEKEQAFKNQQAELDRLHENKSIDTETYNRLSTLMRMNEQNLEDTMNTLINAKNIGKKQKTKHKLAPEMSVFE